MRKLKEHTKQCLIIAYLPPEEFYKIRERFQNSIYRSLSEYCRKLLTQKPVRTYYRNKSFDEFVDVAIELRNELRRIGDKKWLTFEGEVEFLQLVNHIQVAINKLVDQCMQT
ncbi:hypothetical protein ACX0G9_26990 [Flavitalea flava]